MCLLLKSAILVVSVVIFGLLDTIGSSNFNLFRKMIFEPSISGVGSNDSTKQETTSVKIIIFCSKKALNCPNHAADSSFSWQLTGR